jgi:hypothetical protein
MGDGDPKPWFWDSKQGIGVTDVELSRDEKTVVGIAGFTDQLLRVYRPLFDPYNAPAQDLTPWGTNTPVVEHCAELSNPAGGRFSSPTLRFTKRARRSLARKRSVRLTVRVKAGTTRGVSVTLRRA